MRFARFAKTVEISGGRPVSECEASLSKLTRPPFTLRGWRARPFVGQVQSGNGRLWFSRRNGLSTSARNLKFRLTATESGCRLDGELVPVLSLRIFTGFYLIFCFTVSPALAIGSLMHGGSYLYVARLMLQGPLLGIAFLYGYTAFAVWVGKRAEALGLKVIKHIMADEESAAVVVDLLSSSR